MSNSGNVFVQVLQFLVQWILVPIVLGSMLLLSARVAVSNADLRRAISKRMALGLGFAIFILIVIVNVYMGPLGIIPFENDLQNIATYVLIGIILGALIMLVIHLFARTWAVSVFIALLSSTSLVGLYYYMLTAQSRDPILLIVVGLLVGELAYATFNPDLVQKLRS